MNARLFAQTFATIFLAELGDKTQLATLSFASGGGSKWAVFGGAALALTTTSALAVLGGDVISRFLSPIWLKRIAGAAFIVLGVLFLLTKPEPPAEGGASDKRAGESVTRKT